MTSQYYDKEALQSTPSIRDGINYDTERRYRREGAQLIINMGKDMSLGCNAIATGVIFFHRFYMLNSFVAYPRYVTACCCLFLAGKVQETPKKSRDIVNVAQKLLSKEKFLSFGDDPKEKVIAVETRLLQTIRFDFEVEYPYTYIIEYAKCLKGDKKKLEKTVQMAWNFANDSLCTTLSIEWEPEIIAIAAIYLAVKLRKFKVMGWDGQQSHHLRWWDLFVEDLSIDILEDISHQVLDLYSPATRQERPETPPPATAVEPSVRSVVPGRPIQNSTVQPSPAEQPLNTARSVGAGCPIQNSIVQPSPVEQPLNTVSKVSPTDLRQGSGSIPPSNPPLPMIVPDSRLPVVPTWPPFVPSPSGKSKQSPLQWTPQFSQPLVNNQNFVKVIDTVPSIIVPNFEPYGNCGQPPVNMQVFDDRCRSQDLNIPLAIKYNGFDNNVGYNSAPYTERHDQFPYSDAAFSKNSYNNYQPDRHGRFTNRQRFYHPLHSSNSRN